MLRPESFVLNYDENYSKKVDGNNLLKKKLRLMTLQEGAEDKGKENEDN